jgi:hypothetical protein
MRVILLIIVIIFSLNSNAQKIDCSLQTKEYQEFLKVKNYSDAFSPWEFVKDKCPSQSKEIYTDGIKIIQYKIDNAATPEEKEKLVRDLLSLYNKYNKNFPETTQDYEVYKGLALLENNIDAKDEMFQYFDNGFSKALDKVTSANAIFNYFKLLIEKNQNGDKSVSSDKIIEKYSLLSNKINNLFTKNPEERESYIAARKGVNSLANEFLNCDNLTSYYEKRLPQNQENEVWLQASLNTLSDKCSATPIFLAMAERYYALKVSSQSSSYLAIASLKNRKFDEAKKHYIESAELESDLTEKATKYYTLATGLFSGDKVKAKEFLLKSLEFNPKLGKAYLFLAQLYSSSASDCGKTPFEKKAVHYLAQQTVKKAAIADERLKANVDIFIKNSSKESLSPKDISDAKMNGKSMTIGCWINEEITFSTK